MNRYKMFEGIKARLDSIDAVLNEPDMDAWNQLDRSKGFDPTKDYAPDELKKLYLSGLEAFKKGGKESRYLLLEVRLESESLQFAKLYLRGFDMPLDSHPALAERFLRRELQTIVTPPFDLPSKWPSDERRENYDPSITRESEGLKLTVSAIGGGKFDLKNNGINLRGSSLAFGSVPQAYQDKFKELLEQLVQRPAYGGYQINFG